ncbi:MAG: DUF4202 domain-containing protein [Hydrogenophilales bacterium CG17_big_fil_post_rev_8_21_14_2_50_63_12]|nr:MAG: DUF4202 domain-containing protein [Hydrogenophilales bacterium CG17_big_fil_post_rev_8_21_14_2_50_63_12]PIX97658.1 MAG: DUF4202 domain-containing protein [Hydrogenophilales bacterium CG_4_10_14_3_um_filter_63_21]PJB04076.1 MAG: DUF4202 domain-containing protein [Hydrogenophilales bacterium CG_4_9_14_3_um_filter_63_34]
MIEKPECFNRAIALFDAANGEDPNQDEGQPKELLYAQRMTEMLHRFAPDAPEAAQLAVRAQHIKRWTVPRDSYPMTKEGYFAWRTGLYKFHADTAGELMRQAGYGDAMIERVKKAVGKRALKVNPDTQQMEDTADLVFIEYYMLGFAAGKPDYNEEKWLEIIRKTWKKMSETAHTFALSGQLKLPEPLLPLITKAISG